METSRRTRHALAAPLNAQSGLLCGIGMLDRIDAIRCDAPMRLPLRSTAPPRLIPWRRLALFHGVASPCSPPVRRRRSVSFCRVSSLLFAAAPPSSLHFAPPGPSPLRPIGLSPLRSRGLPPLCPIGLSRFRSTGAVSTSLHRRDDARKTADLRRRSPSPGGEFQQKCDVMGTVALHRGFPLMRMIFFDKTPPRDPCLWGEVE